MIGKLYKQMCKETLKPIGIALGLAWAFLALFLVSSFFSSQGEWISVTFIIQFFVLFAAHLAIYFITIVQDYKNMEGARSYFYRSIPASGREFTAARTLYYLTFSLLTMVSAGLQLFLSVFRSIQLFTAEPGSPSMDEMLDFIGQMVKPLFFSSATPIFILSLITGLLLSAAVLSFSVTVGSAWFFRKLGAGGPVVVLIITQFAQTLASFAFGFILHIPTGDSFDAALDGLPATASPEEVLQVINDELYQMLSSQIPLLLLSLAFTFLFWALTVYTTDRKIDIR
ncbi:hypothetical protein [Kallipyga massiliensis]|uniref:hypothetical protein n=1 Tax=Kallipyga massiliensis TaxID=1472764 RepID=UPI0004B8665A|nr:hypothetical protein [Kallipyga massiliensis]